MVVGGGPTGVETTGALAELMRALRRTGRLDPAGRVTVVDRSPVLLGQFSRKAHDYALRKLTEVGVQVKLETGVTAVHPDRVEFDDATTIAARTVVWGGGESGAAVAQTLGSVLGRGGRLDVRRDLTVEGHPGVYAVGDVANIPSRAEGAPALPQLGSVAQQSGLWAAENILRELRHQPVKPFRYKDKGIMAMIGRDAAVAEVGKHRHQVEGPLAFAAWLGVHAMLISGVHSRTDAFLAWAWDYFERDHSATVEASSAPRRIAWGGDDRDVPHISLDRPEPADTPARRENAAGPARQAHTDSREMDVTDRHYDVIIIGTGAGGGTLAHRLAPSGKQVLLLERGGYLPRERDNWDSTAVFVKGKYRAPEFWYDAHGAEFPRRSTTTSGATPSSTGRRCSGCARRISASCATTAASPRPGRSATRTSSRTTRKPNSSTWCTAATARTPPRARSAGSTSTRRCSTSRGSSSCPTTWRSRACTPSTCPSG
ncbi:NAD(P)/FAD-dependent oxidoreductase [Pseudonocardia sp. T1-2H]|uniref:NAD(P)/FAD-dependent oxidoreductase n=1 Tax=Pseudonocardia sp. T1-2H TaxID=3128899 RepID=UPI0031019D3C